MAFTAQEAADIKQSWELPKANLGDFGTAVLISYITNYSENLSYFPFKDIPITDLNFNERFHSHATKIMTVFDNSIAALNSNEAKVTQIWEDLAETHVKRHIPEESYLQLKDTIVDVLCKQAKLTDAQKDAWHKLLDYLYEILFKKMAELGA